MKKKKTSKSFTLKEKIKRIKLLNKKLNVELEELKKDIEVLLTILNG